MPQDDNLFYHSCMEKADSWIVNGRIGLNNNNDLSSRNNALDAIARAIVYAQYAMMYGTGKKGPNADEQTAFSNQFEDKVKKIRESEQFQVMFAGVDNQQLYELMTKPKEKGAKEQEGRREPASYDDLAANLEKREKTMEGRMGALVYQLEHSTQRSFLGKLKSIFAGNSQQYKDALAAMKGLACGTIKEPEDVKQAKDAIKDYILERGGKVRDHQYGRDRFDAFMRGLGEIMTPEEFVEVCEDVNDRRRDQYGRNTDRTVDPVAYMTTKEQKAAVAVEKDRVDQRAGAKMGRENGDVEVKAGKSHEKKILAKAAEERKEEEQKEQIKRNEEIAKQKAIKKELDIKTDEKNILRDEEVKHIKSTQGNMDLIERSQYELDRLRKYSAHDMRNSTNGIMARQTISERLKNHPAFRLAAENIIHENGLDELFDIPETQLDKMSPEAVKALRGQVNELQTLDQQKNPNLTIKFVKVEVPEKTELNKGAEISL